MKPMSNQSIKQDLQIIGATTVSISTAYGLVMLMEVIPL